MKRTEKNIICFMVIVSLCAPLLACGKTEETGEFSSDEETGDNRQDVTYDVESYKSRIQEERISIAECREQYGEDIQKVQNADYKNLHFEDTEFQPLPDAEEVGLLKEVEYYISVDDSWNAVEKMLSDMGKLNEVDLESELYITQDLERYEQEKGYDEYGLENWPLFYLHRSDLEDGVGALVQGDDCYVYVLANGVYAMSNGKISGYLNSLGYDTEATNDAMGDNSTEVVETGTLEQMGNKQYELLQGDLTIGEGAELATKYFLEDVPLPYGEDVSLDIVQVDVFRLGDVYGYDYTFRRMFRDVPFAYFALGTLSHPDNYSIRADAMHALLADDTGVAAFWGNDRARNFHVLTSENRILSLADAVEIVREKIASKTNIYVDNTELVYFPLTFEEDANETIAFPCWEFRGTNVAKDEYIWVYVDVLTGDIYYYTSRIEE